MQCNFGAAPFRFAPVAGSIRWAGLDDDSSAKSAAGLVIAHSAASGMPAGDDAAAATAARRRAGGGRPPLVLVLEPTKDLAEQTFRAYEDLARHVASPPVRPLLISGAVDTKDVTRKLREGVEVIIGTPSRILDFASGPSAALDLSQVLVLILDEADRLVSDGEDRERLAKVWSLLPKTSATARLQVCFFSATLHSHEITQLSEQMCHHPIWVDLKGKDRCVACDPGMTIGEALRDSAGFRSVPETVHHVAVLVDPTRDLAWSGPRGKDVERYSDAVHGADAMRGRDMIVRNIDSLVRDMGRQF